MSIDADCENCGFPFTKHNIADGKCPMHGDGEKHGWSWKFRFKPKPPYVEVIRTRSEVISAAPQEVGGTHYKQGLQVTPWDLQRTMATSGSAFVDGRICDVIKYVWRSKGDAAKRLEDLKKAQHCLTEAIKEMEKA